MRESLLPTPVRRLGLEDAIPRGQRNLELFAAGPVVRRWPNPRSIIESAGPHHAHGIRRCRAGFAPLQTHVPHSEHTHRVVARPLSVAR